MEKNIALALYNKGLYAESVEHFDKALDQLWGRLPKHAISAAIQFISGFLHLLVSLYLPSLKFRKIPTQDDKEAVDLFFKKLKALAIINPKKFFIESFHFYKRFTNYGLANFESGIGMFVGASTFFSFTGISFRLSRKILDLVKDKIHTNDIRSFTIYDFSETLHNYFEGSWNAIKDYDADLVERNLNIGETYWASQHIFWHILPKIYQGYPENPKSLMNKLNEIYKVYENDLSIILEYYADISLSLEYRKLQESLDIAEQCMEFIQNKSQPQTLIHMLSCKAQIQILLGDIEGAKGCLKHADKIRQEVNTVPWQLSGFFRSRFEYDLHRLRESLMAGNKALAYDYRLKAARSRKRLLKVARKAAQHRTESYKQVGVYYWIIDKQRRALKWWHKAVEEGERLGARSELSRVYFEVGKSLLEAKSRYAKLNGIEAKEYLQKARRMYVEMDLQWDLNELNRLDLN